MQERGREVARRSVSPRRGTNGVEQLAAGVFRGIVGVFMMDYAEILNSPLARWSDRERNWNDWYVNLDAFDPLPTPGERTALQCIDHLLEAWVPVEEVEITSDPKRKPILKRFTRTRRGGKREARLLIHPFATEQFGEILRRYPAKRVSATATSSFRSFFVEDAIIKVSLPKGPHNPWIEKILYGAQIERSVRMSRILGSVRKRCRHRHRFDFLPESLGIYLRDRNNAFGMLVREIPAEVLSGKRSLISLVSYVHRPNGEGQSLLEKHISRSGFSPDEFLSRTVVSSLLQSFLFAYRECGVTMEPHQQNVLLELDSNDDFTGRIYYRDLDGCRVDLDSRVKKGKDNGFLREVSDPDWIFQLKKVDEFKERIRPELKSSPHWNGNIEFVYRRFLEQSSLHLLEKAVGSSNVVKLAERDLNRMLRYYHPELFMQ